MQYLTNAIDKAGAPDTFLKTQNDAFSKEK
jgi:hypothetical protein